MGKAPRAAAITAQADADEPKIVRLYRLQDRFFAPAMTRAEADEILAGFPGEYEELTDGKE